ncbi:hypothetical protein [Cupriavidus sp. YAF13]|uniref:hypothetical protein n=1 Tax=Cupriavidus sp. YAF13 TaxID=3233075 RepID=UPI003F9339BD
MEKFANLWEARMSNEWDFEENHHRFWTEAKQEADGTFTGRVHLVEIADLKRRFDPAWTIPLPSTTARAEDALAQAKDFAILLAKSGALRFL